MISVSQAFNQVLIERWALSTDAESYDSGNASTDMPTTVAAGTMALQILHTCRYNSFDSHVHLKVTMASSPVETTKLG